MPRRSGERQWRRLSWQVGLAVIGLVSGFGYYLGNQFLAATTHNRLWPTWWLLVPVGICTVALLAMVVPVIPKRRGVMTDPVNPSGPDKDRTGGNTFHTTSHGQIGGVTAGQYINEAPEPELRGGGDLLRNQQREDGTFLHRLVLEVVAPYPPANLFLYVPGASAIEVHPQRSGVVMIGNSGSRADGAFTNLQQPSGILHLDILTAGRMAEAVGFELEYDFT